MSDGTCLGLQIYTAAEIEDHDMVTDVVVIAKMTNLAGDDYRPSVVLWNTQGMDWVTQTGLLEIARYIVGVEEE